MKVMKKILLTLIFTAAAITATETLQAQSLQGLLNLFANTKAAKSDSHAAGELLTAEQLTASTWVYDAPQIVYSGNSSMATVAIATLRTQMTGISKAMGLNAGSDTVTFHGDGNAIMQNGEQTFTAPYTYDAANGTLSVTLTRKEATAAFPATVTAKDGIVTILFDADTSMETLLKMAPELKENPSLVIIKTVVDKYPGIKIGATLKAK